MNKLSRKDIESLRLTVYEFNGYYNNRHIIWKLCVPHVAALDVADNIDYIGDVIDIIYDDLYE
jgi:hypothetical protein